MYWLTFCVRIMSPEP